MGDVPELDVSQFRGSHGSEEGPGGDDLRYRLTTEAGKLTKLQCRNCGLNISLFSSASLREIARL